MNTQKFQQLTKENIKLGSIVRNIKNANWGTFRVTKQYDDTIWEIGERTLFESDFKYWEIQP